MITAGDLRSVVAFAKIDDGELAQIASRCADVRLAAGEWLFREGEPARFYAVISGELEVVKQIAGFAAVLIKYGTGDSFGEVPLLLGSPAISSVRATLPTQLAALETTEFWRLMHAHDDLAAIVAENMARRVSMLRASELKAPAARCSITGPPNSAECHRLRDFLTRLRIPFDWDARDSECTVAFSRGKTLVSPTLRQVAEALGLRTAPRDHCYDVAVVGAGPAGLAAAVYGASEGLSTILLEREAPGGQAGTSSRIENYLGFPNGISGDDLADRAFQQVQRFGADVVVTREARSVDGDDYARRIVLDEDETIASRCVVIATGAAYRYLPARGCDEYLNRGVYYGAAQSEARRVSGQRIHLVGGGNSAGQAAMFFSHYAEHVDILIRADSLNATMSSYLIEELNARADVSVVANTQIEGVEGRKEVETVVLRDGNGTRREP
ncbi:MAG: FAD-dependent oxidoreductase, partial [Candidatus Eremiobacteraeota bacterium]|nr:FAD-dependent oxidoreductase [Candidatus Eremiobacteraeota bacterium]